MTDRELLEAAAKAAGCPSRMVWPVKSCPCGGYQQSECFDGNCRWAKDPSLVPEALRTYTNLPAGRNPLTDDGDALRLAVKLRMNVRFDDSAAVMAGWAEGVRGAPTRDGVGPWFWKEWINDNPDTFATTRRAIVRAAAALCAPLPKDEPECPSPAAPPAGGEGEKG